jgi:hypothetical protein
VPWHFRASLNRTFNPRRSSLPETSTRGIILPQFRRPQQAQVAGLAAIAMLAAKRPNSCRFLIKASHFRPFRQSGLGPKIEEINEKE